MKLRCKLFGHEYEYHRHSYTLYDGCGISRGFEWAGICKRCGHIQKEVD